MTQEDVSEGEKSAPADAGIEYRATIRFPRKDYEFMQKLIESGEYANITDIVRDAVKRFRLEWRDIEAVERFMPMSSMMGMMPRMRRMMRSMCEGDEKQQ